MHTRALAGLVVVAGYALCADPSAPVFRSVDVDSTIQVGYGIAAADVDGDAKVDVVLVDKHQVVWYRNPDWRKSIIAENLTPRDHVCLAAADVDGDGKAEIAVGAEWNPTDTLHSGAVFTLIPPADRTQRWQPVRLHAEPTVHRMRWVSGPGGTHDLVVVPLHGRGYEGTQGAGARILSYARPADPRTAWTTTLIDASLHLTHNFTAVRWSQPAAEDLLVAATEGVFHFSRVSGGWQRQRLVGNHPGETVFVGAGEVRAGTLPNGHKFLATVEPMHGSQVVVYTPPEPDEPSPLWHRTLVDHTLVDGHAVACGDLLRVGSDQLVVGWRAMNQPGVRVGIRFYTPLDAQGRYWRTSVVDDNTMACEDLCLADLNGDGRLDIVASGRATHNVKIYFNEGGELRR